MKTFPARRYIARAAARTVVLPGKTALQAIGTGAFWAILLSILSMSVALYAFRAHSVAWLTDRGISGGIATSIVSVMALSGLIGQIGSGLFLDRVQTPRVAVPFFAAAFFGLGLMIYGQSTYVLFAAAVILGTGFGSQLTVMPYFVSRYFGLWAYSEIVGYVGAAIAIGSGVGALLMGLIFDRLGSYRVALAACEAALVLGTVLISLLGPYVYSARRQASAAEPEKHELPASSQPQASGKA